MASAQQAKLMELLLAESGAISTSDLAKKADLSTEAAASQLKRLAGKGFVIKDAEGNWILTEAGRDDLIKPHLSQDDIGATDYARFEALGKQIGVTADLIGVTTEHVFTGGNYRDLNWVWEALGQMGIRQDLKGRWFHAWRSFLKQGIPPELREEIAASTETVSKEQGALVRKPGRDYIIVDDEPVRVGEGLGDYTLPDAKDILSLRTLRERFRASGVGAASQTQPEPISSILTALQPWLKQDTNLDTVKELLEAKMQLMQQSILHEMPKSPATGGQQPKTFMEQITDFVSALGSLKAAGPTLRAILGLPEQPANPSTPMAMPVQLKDKDGNPMLMDINSAIAWAKFLGDEKRADEKQEMLKGGLQTFQQEWPVLASALKSTAERFNRMAAQGGRGQGRIEEEGLPPGRIEAKCPNCQQSFPLIEVPTGEIPCPKCGAMLVPPEV